MKRIITTQKNTVDLVTNAKIFRRNRAPVLFRLLLICFLFGRGIVFGQSEGESLGSSVPGQMNYQGQLVDADGNPWPDGEYAMIFNIYDAAEVGQLVWGPYKLTGEQISDSFQPKVTVVNGHFNVVLGPFDMPEQAEIRTDEISEPGPEISAPHNLAKAFDGSARYLEITIDGGVLSPRQQILSTPFAMKAENSNNLQNKDLATIRQEIISDAVPVGTVIDWWRPDDSFLIPKNYQVADGSEVTDPKSPLHGETLPNLVDKFVMGVGSIDQIATTGGSSNHRHNIDLPNHNHTANHDHGTHYHPIASFTNNTRDDKRYWDGYFRGIKGRLVTYGDGHSGDAGKDSFPLGLRGDHNTMPNRDISTGHNAHPGAKEVVSSSYDFSPAPTDAIQHLPPYVGLLKLVRIR